MRRFRIHLPLLLACTPCPLGSLPCREPGCWGAEGHNGCHTDGAARWTAKGRP